MWTVPSASDVDGVLKRANDTEFGLASGVFTRDINKAMYVSEKLQAGTVFVNTYNKTDVASPFGGFKQSGIGKDLGKTAVYTHTGIPLYLKKTSLDHCIASNGNELGTNSYQYTIVHIVVHMVP